MTVQNNKSFQTPAGPDTQSRPPKFARVRNTKYADYDWDTIQPILASSLVAHIGFVNEDRPMVIPMAFAIHERTLYLHGAKATRIIKGVANDTWLCATFTHVDGIVIARSAFHHSCNYRSAVLQGRARLVNDFDEHTFALKAITEHLLPGRWDEARPMNEKEQKATGVLALDIEYASAKIRQGGPIDDAEDYGGDVWAGVLPTTLAMGQPLDDGKLPKGTAIPQSTFAARRKFL